MLSYMRSLVLLAGESLHGGNRPAAYESGVIVMSDYEILMIILTFANLILAVIKLNKK